MIQYRRWMKFGYTESAFRECEVSFMKMRALRRLLLMVLALLAFAYAASADVWLPASLTEIEAQAFMNASWLSGTCKIPDGTKRIGAQAFSGCSGITSLVIPDSVTFIGSGAFAGCSGITGSITIPEGCEVADDAFAGCTRLSIVYAGEEAASPAELFKWKVSGGKATITGYKGGKDVTSIVVPASLDGCPVTAIDDYVFSSSRYLTRVSLPNTLTSIGDYAFAYCTRLTSVSVPASVTEIGRYAFYYCTGLTGNMNLFDATIPSNAFTGCTNLSVFAYATDSEGGLTLSRYYGSAKSVTVPDHVAGRIVTAIGREAFSYRTSLQTVSLPASITSIGQSAFYYCSGLQSLSVPAGVTSIGPSAFYNCTSLTQIDLSASIDSVGNMAFYNCAALRGQFTFIDASIKSSAFSSCPGVEVWCYELIAGDGLQLASCVSSAEAFTIPASVGDYAVVSMKAQAFYGCKSISSVTLSANFMEIPAEAFSKCTTLQQISIPDGVTTIGDNAFYGCSALRSVSIPATVRSVGKQAFYNCTSLRTLVLNNDVMDICSYAFAGCTQLSDVTLPGDGSNVGNMAFNGTPWLTAKINDIAREATAGCSNDYEKALALHDWLIGNTAYDESYTHYGSEGVLFHGKGVCNAYTLTYSRMLSAVGVTSKTVTGTATDRYSGASGSHAWTLVLIDGLWWHVDTTWDDPIPDGRERYTYFALTDAQMAVDHTWDTDSYPAATGKGAVASTERNTAPAAEADETVCTQQRDKRR